jgi:fibronectin type 3 domain-containing protein
MTRKMRVGVILLSLAAVVSGLLAPSTASSSASPIVIIFMENHNLSYITSNPSLAPYEYSLWLGTASSPSEDMTNYQQVGVGSLPDYLAFASGIYYTGAGSKLGGYAGPSLWDQLTSAGISWAVYQEGMPSACSNLSSYDDPATQGQYNLYHNPAENYSTVYGSSECQNAQPLSALKLSALPAVSFMTPNYCDDMHGMSTTQFPNCAVGSTALAQRSDAWLANWVPQLVNAGATVFITYDEGSGPLYAVETGPFVINGSKFTGATNHYGLLAGVENAEGLPLLGGAATTLPVPFKTASPVAPSAPQSLAATAGSGSVSLTWTPPASNGGSPVTGYDVYRGTSAGGESATPIATNLTGTSFTDKSINNGTTYYYTVAAVNAAGVSPPSGEASATPQPLVTAPSAPQSLAATGGSGSVSLSWAAPSSNGGSPVTGYDIYRGASPGAESATPVASNVTAASYADTGLTDGTTYYYTVAAVNAAGVSPPSGEASATPQALPPTAPANLTAAAAGPTQVNLAWTAATPGSSPISGYQITRNGTVIATTTTTATSYSDTTVAPGTGYSYTVAAVDATGNIGPASNAATITTPANLLLNPGFETWSNGLPVGWTKYGPATTFTQSSDAHSGSSSVMVATTSTGYAASGLNDGATPTINSTIAGTTYTASCWAKATKVITINVQLHEFKHNWTSVNPPAVTSLTVPTTTSWYFIQVSYTAVGTGNMMPMSVYSTNTKGGGATFEVDDCSLTSAP